MYSHLPPRQQRNIRASLTVAWGLSGLAGASSLAYGTHAFDLLAVTAGIAAVSLIAMATIAGVGTALNRYRMEWVAAWFAAAALAPYTLVYWYSVFSVDLGRMSSGFLLTALLAFFVSRAIMCSAHAERLRLMHEGELGHE